MVKKNKIKKKYKLRCQSNRLFFGLKYRNRSEETCEHLEFRGYLSVGETLQNQANPALKGWKDASYFV